MSPCEVVVVVVSLLTGHAKRETPDEVDCAIDGAPSRGFVERWHWSYWTGGAALGHTTTTALSRPRLPPR